MSEWVRLTTKSKLPVIGEAKEFDCNGKMICVANVNGDISALDNVCPHRGGPLGQGTIDGEKIICPWHGWMINARTGAIENNDVAKQLMYPIQIDGEEVKISI